MFKFSIFCQIINLQNYIFKLKDGKKRLLFKLRFSYICFDILYKRLKKTLLKNLLL